MTIQSDDIKLLASAVMADVPEGGGAATGTEIVDGQSNNIFPDISADARAEGQVGLRKVFGKADTDNDDALLGASSKARSSAARFTRRTTRAACCSSSTRPVAKTFPPLAMLWRF